MKEQSEMEGGIWGIVVIISAFMIQFISFGISGSIGVYNVEFLEYFETDAREVSILSAINMGLFMGAGPIASYLMVKYSHRKVVLVGGLMSTLGIIVLPWLPSIPYMYVFYGLINGLGGCLSYVPSHVLVGLYYDKRCGLATGMATGGSGLGITVGPIVIAFLIEVYTWKGSLMILAGISLNVLVFAALLRPPPLRKTSTIIVENPRVQSISENVKIVDQIHTISMTILSTDSQNNVTKEIIPTTATTHQNNTNNTILPHKTTYFSTLLKYILTNRNFMIYFVNNIFWNVGVAVALAFLIEYIVQHDISKLNSALIATVSGFGNFSGCFMGGILSNIKRLNSFYTCCVVNVLQGMCLIILPFVSGFNAYLIDALLFGVFSGIIIGYVLAITAEILGPEHFGDGVGILMISNGIGAFAGPFIAGYLEEDYGLGLGLIVGGIMCVVGGLVILMIPLRNCFTKQKYCRDGKQKDRKKLNLKDLSVDIAKDKTHAESVTVISRETMFDVSQTPNTGVDLIKHSTFYKDVGITDEE